MVSERLAAKWTPKGLLQRIRQTIREPADVVLALEIGYFLCRAPADLRRHDLDSFLRQLRSLPRPYNENVQRAKERIVRLRQAWLSLPPFKRCNTCYVRALTLYRFLEAGKDRVGLHFGVEQSDDANERLRGHAWVTLNGEVLEGPNGGFSGRLYEMKIPGTSA
jgi:hypothetical protein